MSKQLDSILGRAPRATPAAVAAPAATADDARALQRSVAERVAKPTRPKDPVKSGARPKRTPTEPEPAAAEPQRPIQAIVPVSVARALAIRAATEDTTVRDLILRGLAAIGVDVPEHECRDRRR